MNFTVDVTSDPTAIAGMATGSPYFIYNLSPYVVYTEEAAAAPDASNAAPIPIQPNERLPFTPQTGESLYVWVKGVPQNATPKLTVARRS